jgi:nucleoside-diphosphate-sugar epimerase
MAQSHKHDLHPPRTVGDASAPAPAAMPCAGLGLTSANFRPIARNGFGDPANVYCHAMAYYNGNLYVGTTRHAMALLRLFPPIDMPALDPWPVSVPRRVQDLDMHGNIWRWSADTEEWKLVLRSPDMIGKNSEVVPRDLGYRGMAVFQGRSDAVPALYVASLSTVLRGTAALILRTYDGENYEVAGEPGLGNPRISTFRALHSFDGHLYAPPAGEGVNFNSNRASLVMRSADPKPGNWEPACESGFGDSTNNGIFEMCVFNDHLYAGTFNHYYGYQIWKTRANGGGPCQWKKVVERGAYRGPLNEIAMSFCAFNDALYVGSAIQNGGYDRYNLVGPASGEIIRIYPDDSWELIVGSPRDTPDGKKYPRSGYGPGFDSLFAGYIWRMAVHEDWLYVTTFDYSDYLKLAHRSSPTIRRLVAQFGADRLIETAGGFDLFRTRDGVNWLPVSRNGMGNPYNYGGRTLVSTPQGLYIGTANPFAPEAPAQLASRWVYVPNPDGGCEVWLGNANYSFIEESQKRGGVITVSGVPPRRVTDIERGTCIAVTGGAGYLGRNLVARLLKSGHRVKVLDLPGTEKFLPQHRRLSFIGGGLADRDAMSGMLEDASIVIHLAAQLGGSCPTDEMRRVNIDGTHALLSLIRNDGRLKRLVFSSSTAVYSGQYKPVEWPIAETAPLRVEGGNDLADYGLSKVAGENLVRWYAEKRGFSYTVMRFSLVYGSGDASTAQLIQQAAFNPQFGEDRGADYPHQYVHVDDAVEGLMRGIFMDAARNETFNIAGADVVSHRDIAKFVRRLQGRAGGDELIPDRTRMWRRYTMIYDIGKVRRVLDFLPSISTAEGLTRMLDELAVELVEVDT